MNRVQMLDAFKEEGTTPENPPFLKSTLAFMSALAYITQYTLVGGEMQESAGMWVIVACKLSNEQLKFHAGGMYEVSKKSFIYEA